MKNVLEMGAGCRTSGVPNAKVLEKNQPKKPFQREKYLEKYIAVEYKEIMELRLNIIDIRTNFEGKY